MGRKKRTRPSKKSKEPEEKVVEKPDEKDVPKEPTHVVEESESPVVSDDDGVDVAARALGDNEFLAAANVEVISDSSDGEDEEEAAVPRRPRPFNDGGSDSDSSTEGAENPVGDIPMRWYEGYDHIGYTRDGQKFVPRNKPNALELAADPHAWRRVYDEVNDEEFVLSHAELKAIARLRAGKNPHGVRDEHGEVIAWSGPIRKTPLPSGTEPKRRFLPSRHEARIVVRYVRAMREGRMRRPSERRQRTDDGGLRYDLWAGHEPKTREEMTKSERARDIMKVPAPKVPLPKHDESYNPPTEYLPSKEEREQWEKTAPEDRVQNYLPEKSDSLRHVPGYSNLIRERFERCLDLYLAVRIKKDVQQINPDDLLPKLPSPKDLRPFPTGKVLEFGPLPSRARTIDVHPAGQWLLSGSDDGIVRLWETGSGFMRAEWNLGKRLPKVDGRIQPIMKVAWRPAIDSYVFAACVGKSMYIVAAANALGISDVDAEELLHGKGEGGDVDGEIMENGNREGEMDDDSDSGDEKEKENQKEAADSKKIEWKDGHIDATSAGRSDESRCDTVKIEHSRVLRGCSWHKKGDYIVSYGRDSHGGLVAIHRLTQRNTRILFKKRSTNVQCVRFHPTRPFLLVASMHHVRIYNLAENSGVKVLKPGVRWISDVDVHRTGDHVLISAYDKKVSWHDLDFSVRPYKTLRSHDRAVRSARYHPRLPLFADASDDGSVHVFHGMTYDDLAKNALIVPVRRLVDAHEVVDSLGVLAIAWHPTLPWLFTAGADRRICLFVDTS